MMVLLLAKLFTVHVPSGQDVPKTLRVESGRVRR